MKKLGIILLLILLLMNLPVSAASVEPDEALNELYRAAPPEIRQVVKGDTDAPSLDLSAIVNFLSGGILSALSDNIGTFFSLLAVLVLIGIYDTFQDKIAAKGFSRITDFFCAAVVVLLVCPPLLARINELKSAIADLNSYTELSLPVLTGLLISGGQAASAGVFHLFIYLASILAGSLFSGILLPLCSIYICLGVSAAVTDHSGMRRLAKGAQSVTNKSVMIVCFLFTILLSLQGILAGAGDGVAKKTLKFAVGAFLPLTGNIMSESVDTFLSGIGVIRSVAGVIGTLAIFYWIIIPIVKTAANFLLLKGCQLIGDLTGNERVSRMLGVIADAYRILIALAAGVGVMFTVCMAFLMLAGGGT